MGYKKLKQVVDIFPSNVDKKESDNELPIHLCNYTEVYNNSRITSNLDFMEATAKKSDIQKFHLEGKRRNNTKGSRVLGRYWSSFICRRNNE